MSFARQDQILFQITKCVKPLLFIEPLNEPDEKKRFFKYGKEPVWQCARNIPYNPSLVQQQLNSLCFDNTPLGVLYQKKVADLLLQNEIIKHRHDAAIVRRCSEKLYGAPSSELVKKALRTLRSIPPSSEELTVPVEHVKRAMDACIRRFGMPMRVEYSAKWLTTCFPIDGLVLLCSRRKFVQGDAQRLVSHELLGHAFQGLNGLEQPYGLFAMGLPDCSPTAEGVALVMEELTGHSRPAVIRNYAARVLAVKSVLAGMRFSETYDMLRHHNMDEECSWTISVRAHRGGGFIKDHIYFQGLNLVKEYLRGGGSLRNLYVGSVGVHNVKLVKRLLQEGKLLPPAYYPRHVDKA